MNFSQFWDSTASESEYPIASLSKSDAELFGALNSTVWLSRQSLDDHKLKHPEIGPEHYLNAQQIIDAGEVYQQNLSRYVLLHLNGELLRAAIKLTQDRSKVYLLTLFRTSDEKADKEVRRKFQRVR